jgi:predicted amidohydrolase
MKNTRVSIIQFQPELLKPEENIRRIKPWLDKVPDSHLVILPELANSGYNFNNPEEAMASSEVIDGKGLFQEFLISEAIDRDLFIVAGINERDGNILYNSAILVGPDGLIGKYRKIHLFMNEKDIFQPGNAGLPVFDLGDFRIGIMICFDYLFPEPWRILAQKGADLVCHPSNLITENPHKCLPGISLMNRIYVATANRIGTERDITFNGKSFFTDPLGNTVHRLTAKEPGVASIDLDLNLSRNKMVTPRNHAFLDRRPEIYLP